jgi:hypothetical protein
MPSASIPFWFSPFFHGLLSLLLSFLSPSIHLSISPIHSACNWAGDQTVGQAMSKKCWPLLGAQRD